MTGLRGALVAALLGAALVACSSPAQTPPDLPEDSTAPSATAAGSPGATVVVVPGSPIAGIVIDVDSAGLDDVRGFTLRSSTGDELEFKIGQLENGDEFPPGHLTEHLAAASPVLVFFREENGELVVYRMEDAG
jgi:hypothetical protein